MTGTLKMPSALMRIATHKADLYKNPEVDADGVIGELYPYERNVRITPVDPYIDEMNIGEHPVDNPYDALQTFVVGDFDIEEGHVLIPLTGKYEGEQLAIRAASSWEWDTDDTFVRLILERVVAT